MSAEITVSVCIANYNGMDVIDDCIRSVQNQIGEISVEILVHDDASTDASVLHIQKNYPDVHLIISEKNVGFCIANNRMADVAKGQYLLLLNNDAALYTDGLTSLLNKANTLKTPAILTLPQYDAITGELVDRGCLLDPFYNPVPNLDPARSNVAMAIGACLWLPKAMWDEFGGLPEWFGSIAEDMYICCRARLAGYSVCALPISGYRHWQGKSFGGNRPKGNRLATTIKRRALSERNKTLVMLITCPTPILQILILLHITLLLAEGVTLAIVKMEIGILNKIYVSAIYENLILSKKWRVMRKEIMKKRRSRIRDYLSVFKPIPRKLKLLKIYGLPDVR